MTSLGTAYTSLMSTIYPEDVVACVSCLSFCHEPSLSRFLQWPAAWTTTIKQWPWGGEIDVLEGANSLGNNSIPTVLQPQTNQTSTNSSPRPSNAHESVNVVSLHTAPNCSI